MTDKEIIVTLARDIMGWEITEERNGQSVYGAPSKDSEPYLLWDDFANPDHLCVNPWNPLQYLRDAWMLADRLRRGFEIEPKRNDFQYHLWLIGWTTKWNALFDSCPDPIERWWESAGGVTESETVQRAISLAALTVLHRKAAGCRTNRSHKRPSDAQRILDAGIVP